MSRCFPFPPPGYVPNRVRNDEAIMIESIKGEEEKCKKEQRSKERKRDKKDKKDKKDRKDKKEKKDKKRKERERGEGESEKHSSHKRRRKEEVAKDVHNNCLEKSSLTVERELLQSTSQNSCDSTHNSNEKGKKQPLNGRHNSNDDNTLKSNELPKEKEKQPLNGRHNSSSNELPKQKEKQPLNGRHNNSSNELPKEKQPMDGRHNNNNNDSESIIRIRLPIRRPKDPEVMMITTNKDQPCPSRDIKLDTSRVVTRDEQPQHPCSTSAPEHASSKPHDKKRKDHTSSKKKHREKKLPSTTQETYQPSSLCRFCPPSVTEQFLNLVENWVPSTIESIAGLTNSEDDDSWWLTKKPSSHNVATERCKQLERDNETKQVISSSIAWPRARLLPEADVYALPYTVPF